MTKIKLCGLTRACDIEIANMLNPDYIGFVFAPQSRRYILPEKAAELRKMLDSGIKAVGVFVNEKPEIVASLLKSGTIDIAQLHGGEDEGYIERLRDMTDKQLIKAFRIEEEKDISDAVHCSADYVLLDSGSGGTGTVFDWDLLQHIDRPYFLAGGLSPKNVKSAIKTLAPYGVDVSSGIETDGFKDKEKMIEFVYTVRGV